MDSREAALRLRTINQLIVQEIALNNAGDDIELRTNGQAVLAGWYQSSTAWDLLALRHGAPVLAVKYEWIGNDAEGYLDNQADRVFGIAEDARQAQLHGTLPSDLRRALVCLLEMTPDVQRQIGPDRIDGNPETAFQETSYLDRVVLMCDRMRLSGLFNLVWSVGVAPGQPELKELSSTTNWDSFAKGLGSSGRSNLVA